MIHRGRQRHKTHGGIPHGSTLNLGSSLQIYYRHKEGITSESITTTQEDDSTSTTTNVSGWADQSANANNAAQTTDENEPLLAADGSLDFFHDANDDNADYMDFTKFRIEANNDFLSFIVANLRDVAGSAYLSDSGSECLEYASQNTHKFRTGGGTTAIQINSIASVQTPNSEKHLFMVQRTNGSTGTIKVYKNGFEIDASATNAALFDLEHLGTRNENDLFFDGKIYDIGMIEGTVSAESRNRIVDHLLSKHGVART